jgi:hypothetical protein
MLALPIPPDGSCAANPARNAAPRRQPAMTDPKPAKPSRQQVFTLLVEVGRKAGDGLPKGATGAALMCFASGVDEAEAVRETVAVLKQADLAPLDVSGYGTLDERLAEGHDIGTDERELMDRALAENAVIIAQMTPFYDKPGLA